MDQSLEPSRIAALVRHAKEVDLARKVAEEELVHTKRRAIQEIEALRDRFKTELVALREKHEREAASALDARERAIDALEQSQRQIEQLEERVETAESQATLCAQRAEALRCAKEEEVRLRERAEASADQARIALSAAQQDAQRREASLELDLERLGDELATAKAKAAEAQHDCEVATAQIRRCAAVLDVEEQLLLEHEHDKDVVSNVEGEAAGVSDDSSGVDDDSESDSSVKGKRRRASAGGNARIAAEAGECSLPKRRRMLDISQGTNGEHQQQSSGPDRQRVSGGGDGVGVCVCQ
eukprot:g343.t1